MKSVTDIEKMLEEIKEFNKRIAYLELDSHLVFMCHPDTKKIVNTALKELNVPMDDEHIHIYESNYYSPGDVYMVTDRKLKRQILKQHGIKVQGDEYIMYKTYFNSDGNMNTTTINYTYTTRTNHGFNYWG